MKSINGLCTVIAWGADTSLGCLIEGWSDVYFHRALSVSYFALCEQATVDTSLFSHLYFTLHSTHFPFRLFSCPYIQFIFFPTVFHVSLLLMVAFGAAVLLNRLFTPLESWHEAIKERLSSPGNKVLTNNAHNRLFLCVLFDCQRHWIYT